MNKDAVVQEKKPFPKWAKILIAVLIIIIFLGIISNNDDSSDNSLSKTNSSDNSNGSQTSVTSNKKTYNLDETFSFDGLDITIGSNYSFTINDNRYSDEYQKTVVKLPINVKNTTSETHGLNMFYYNIYGSNGTEVDNQSSYFDNDCIEYAGDLRSGASYDKFIYFIYDGDGKYTIEFDNFSDKIIVEFDIKK